MNKEEKEELEYLLIPYHTRDCPKIVKTERDKINREMCDYQQQRIIDFVNNLLHNKTRLVIFRRTLCRRV